jgi:hypothetical protein
MQARYAHEDGAEAVARVGVEIGATDKNPRCR